MTKVGRTVWHASQNKRARVCPAPSLRDSPIPRRQVHEMSSNDSSSSFLSSDLPILGRSLAKGDSTPLTYVLLHQSQVLGTGTTTSRSFAGPSQGLTFDICRTTSYLTLLQPASRRPRTTAMSSNAPSALSTKNSSTPKSINTSSQLSPAHSQASAFFASEGLGQRRSGGLGSSGAVSRNSATPRNNQTAKTKHKSSKRFQLADDDAFAESVSP